MDKATPDTMSHIQHVGSEPQWTHGHFIILSSKTPTVIRDKMEYRGSPQCLCTVSVH